MNASIPVRPSPRYIALLVSAALLILLVGAVLRPRAKQAVTMVPTNELATLPELTQRRALRDMASYIADRAREVGRSVVYLPDFGASGIVLGQDSVLTAVAENDSEQPGASARVRLIIDSQSTGSAQPVVAKADVDTSPRWRLLVARSPEGRSLALTGMSGGTIETRCGDLALREMIFDAVIPRPFAGGGIFDLDGNAIGLVVPCGSGLSLVPIREVSRLLVQQQSPEYRLWTRYGFRVQPTDSVTGPLPQSGEGLLVTEAQLGSPGYRSGIRAGDVIIRMNGEPASRSEHLAPLLADTAGGRLSVQRTVRGLALNLSSSPAAVRTNPPLPSSIGLALTTVDPDSRAARVGLKPGDRIVQVGRSRKPTPDLLRRVLSDTTPVFLVYERDGRQRAVVLR